MANGRYYIEPPATDHDFRSLLQVAIASGVGRKMPKDGEPVQPWTAEALTTAIKQNEPRGSVIDLRTVQRWLAPHGRGGVSVPNLSRLASVFGGGDPSRTRSWQMALMRARERTRAEQRNGTNDSPSEDRVLVPDENWSDVELNRKPSLARSWESLFSGDDALRLSILIWAAYAVNGLLNGILSLLSVSYSVTPVLSKEVGFIWTPTWTILPALILPLFVMRLSDILAHWRYYGRCRLMENASSENCTAKDTLAWDARLDGTSFPFWVILVLCVGGVFFAQWAGICLRLYADGEAGVYQIDRNLLTLVRPDFIGPVASALTSMFGYLYSALYVFIFLTGIMFLFVLSGDYEMLARNTKGVQIDRKVAIQEGSWIALAAFDAALLIGWAAITIKLQAAYLSSDAPNIVLWLFRDFAAALWLSDELNGSLPNTSVSHFTTFLMIAVANFALFVCATRVGRGQVSLSQSDQDDETPPHSQLGYVSWKTFLCCQAVLAASLLSIGQVQGFSLALICCLAFSVWWLTRPRIRLGSE